MTKRIRATRPAVTVMVLAAVFMLGVQSRAFGTDVRLFSVDFGPSCVPTALTYDLGTTFEPKTNKMLHVLKVTRHLTNDTSWVVASQSGIVFNPAIVRVYDASLQLIATYSLANATVSAVRQYGLASDPFVTEEITLLSPSLSVTTP